MARTVAFPLALNARGGLRTEEDNLGTLISLGLLPSGRGNPYDVRDGLEVRSHVWEADDVDLEAAVRAHVANEFERLEAEGRARLDDVERRTEPNGVVRFAIRWTNLETGESDEVVLPTAVG